MSQDNNDDPERGLTRRQALVAAGATVPAVALAGCTGATEEQSAMANASNRPVPEAPNTSDLDPAVAFLVESARYQNQMLHDIATGESADANASD